MQPSAKSFDDPDEVIELPSFVEEVVELGGFVVGRETAAPGWRWSTHVQPVVGGEWCQAHHVGVIVSGSLAVEMSDGTQLVCRPGDVFDIPPGHDGWAVGDEPCISISWTGLRTFFASKALFPARFLATMLFTDIVGSTAKASELGDTAWADLLGHFEHIVRGDLERAHGREVKWTGDGMLAIFEGPGSAIRCAAATRAAAQRRGLQIRAGIHVGEVESSGSDIRGIAVHEAARVMAAAEPDEILVSETTRALSPSRELAFEDRGEHRLKGVPGLRRLYAYVEG